MGILLHLLVGDDGRAPGAVLIGRVPPPGYALHGPEAQEAIYVTNVLLWEALLCQFNKLDCCCRKVAIIVFDKQASYTT